VVLPSVLLFLRGHSCLDHVVIPISDILILTLTLSPLPMSLLSTFFPEFRGCQPRSLVHPLTQQSYLFLVGGPKVHLFVDHGFNALY
jgi:hypothetical protein